jgi:hypothetical protein
MKHTQGPWYLKEYNNRFHVLRAWDEKVKPGDCATFGSSYGAHIASVKYNSGVPTREQAEANARLIAAAPDMLEALKNIVSVCNSWSDNHAVSKSRDIAEQAIKEAEGE